MFTAKFWKDTTERVVASMAGGFLTTVAGSEAVFNVWEADWRMVAGVSLGAGVVSLAKALIARGVGDRESAALRSEPRRHLHSSEK